MSPPDSLRDTVCAVVVTYDPDDGFAARVDRVRRQAGAVIVVDNGSSEPAASLLRALPEGPRLELVRNGGNLGIATALNVGMRRAAARGFTWALLLDQDTLADEDMVDSLLAAQASCTQGAAPAVIGSRYRDTQGRGAEGLRRSREGALWEEMESVITSGSLVSLAAFAAIGPFRDDFFIDHVDTEYCFRARAAGYLVIETRRPLMAHTIGAPSAHAMLGRTKWTTNHSPDRRYYIARNNTVMLREWGYPKVRSWRMKSLARCLRLCKRIALYESDKLLKIAAVAEGWWDALRGRMGPRRRRGAASTRRG